MRGGKLYGVFVISDDFTLNHWNHNSLQFQCLWLDDSMLLPTKRFSYFHVLHTQITAISTMQAASSRSVLINSFKLNPQHYCLN